MLATLLHALFLFVCLSVGSHPAAAQERSPVYIGLDGEFGLLHSTSAQAIERGIRTALDEINRSGGVLDGRPFRLMTMDNRSIPARGVHNLKAFAQVPDLVAVFGGRFSPVLVQQAPVAAELQMILLAPWSSAEPVVNNGTSPNYVFRLSLRDGLAMPAMLDHAAQRGMSKVGLLLLNTGWGRSNLTAAETYVARSRRVQIAATKWFNFGEQSLIGKYQDLCAAGAEAIILIANDVEGAILVREMAALPEEQRVPVISHWGVTGGTFVKQANSALSKVDLSVIQTFSFLSANPEKVKQVFSVAQRLFGVARIEEVGPPVGYAHAYDLTHILARAIDLAGTTDRAAVRNALEKVTDYSGLVRDFARPFTPDRHEALAAGDVFMARYRSDGVLIPLPRHESR